MPLPLPREVVIELLCRLGPNAKEAVPALKKMISAVVEYETKHAGEIKKKREELARKREELARQQVLEKALEERRRKAIPDAKPAEPPPELATTITIIGQSVRDEEEQLRDLAYLAALVLTHIDPSKEAVGTLLDCLTGKGVGNPEEAAKALRKIGPEAKAALPVLKAMLDVEIDDDWRRTHRDAIRAIEGKKK